MHLPLLRTALAAVAIAAGSAATAADHHYDVVYEGHNVAVFASGSDAFPSVTAPGDSTVYTFSAQEGAHWRIDATDNYFALFALAADQAADRVGDVTLTLWLDGALQQTFAQTDISTGLSHVGTNNVPLAAGLQFDAFRLSYMLKSSSYGGAPVATTLLGPLPALGAPDAYVLSEGISYITPVPEPHSWALFVGGILAGGMVLRRRR